MRATIELKGPRWEVERLVRAMHSELDKIDYEDWSPSFTVDQVLGRVMRRSQTTGTVTIKFGKGEE